MKHLKDIKDWKECVNRVINADCIEAMKLLPDNSIDSIVTDPPYELGFMGKSWDNTGIANSKEMWAEALRVLKPGGHLLAFSGTRTYHRMAVAIEDAGFEVRDMVEYCYGSGFPKSTNLNKQLQKKCTCGIMEVYDKQRTKQNTKHNMRSMSEADVSQKINTAKEQGEVLQSGLSEQGISFSRNSTENVREGQPSLERRNNVKENSRKLSGNDLCEMSEGVSANGEERRIYNATQISDGSTPEQVIDENGSNPSYRSQSEKQQDREPCAFCKQYGTQEIRRLYEETYGVGSALKPSHEPICLARKPISEKTLIDNFIKYGTGGINIDESRVGTEEKLGRQASSTTMFGNGKMTKEDVIDNSNGLGRFPANLIHDNSEEVRECFPETKSGGTRPDGVNNSELSWKNTSKNIIANNHIEASQGNASRFFKSIIYTPKASKSERNMGCEGLEEKENKFGNQKNVEDLGNSSVNDKFTTQPSKNFHPCVKPVALMEYLVKMVTPKNGIVLDPFAGSGSTLVATKKNEFNFIGIDMTEEYCIIADARISSITENPQEGMF